jgi:hypothetical protein
MACAGISVENGAWLSSQAVHRPITPGSTWRYYLATQETKGHRWMHRSTPRLPTGLSDGRSELQRNLEPCRMPRVIFGRTAPQPLLLDTGRACRRSVGVESRDWRLYVLPMSCKELDAEHPVGQDLIRRGCPVTDTMLLNLWASV